jgi:hypothetical protein
MSAQLITQGWGIGLPITVALPQFPDVPQFPGVPQLARSLLFPVSVSVSIGTPALQGALWQATQAAPVWGIFDQDNNQVVTPDSVADFGWRQELRVSNFPVQQGQFASYNRVFLPFESSIVLSKGGALSDRQTFLQQIDALIAPQNVQLYNIATPEKSYLDCTVTRAELSRRGKDNAFYFDVELFFVQVAQVQAQYSTSGTTPTANAQEPSAVPTANNGLSNASVPSPAVQAAAITAITPPKPTG